MEIVIVLLLFVALLVGASPATAYVLRVWFDGAIFFLEYTRLFRLQWLFKSVARFDKATALGMDVSYLEYLQLTKGNSFLVKLVTCEKCIAVWIAAIVSLPILVALSFSSAAFLALAPVVILSATENGYTKYKNASNGKNN